jgi:hypothetical protein
MELVTKTKTLCKTKIFDAPQTDDEAPAVA